MKDWLIKLLGGYTEEDFAQEVLNERVNDLFNTIGPEDILQVKDGVWTVQGKKMNEAQQKMLISEAQLFLDSGLWKTLKIDIKYRANKKMFEESKSTADLVGGKLWLYTLDCFTTRMKSIAKGKIT